jgi:hypothetical protein
MEVRTLGDRSLCCVEGAGRKDLPESDRFAVPFSLSKYRFCRSLPLRYQLQVAAGRS